MHVPSMAVSKLPMLTRATRETGLLHAEEPRGKRCRKRRTILSKRRQDEQDLQDRFWPRPIGALDGAQPNKLLIRSILFILSENQVST